MVTRLSVTLHIPLMTTFALRMAGDMYKRTSSEYVQQRTGLCCTLCGSDVEPPSSVSKVALTPTVRRLPLWWRCPCRYRADLSCKKANCQSTWGIGRTSPDPAGTITLDDGLVVPMGQVRTRCECATVAARR